jgi:hypothetical protein
LATHPEARQARNWWQRLWLKSWNDGLAGLLALARGNGVGFRSYTRAPA